MAFSAKYWRARADEARAIAAELRLPHRKRVMLEIAAAYERLAGIVELGGKSRKAQPVAPGPEHLR